MLWLRLDNLAIGIHTLDHNGRKTVSASHDSVAIRCEAQTCGLRLLRVAFQRGRLQHQVQICGLASSEFSLLDGELFLIVGLSNSVRDAEME